MNKKLLIQLLISMLVSIIIIVGSVYLFNEEPKQNTEEILAKTQEEIKTLQNKIQELKSRDNSSEIEAQIRALKQDVLQATYSFPKDLASSRLLRELSTI